MVGLTVATAVSAVVPSGAVPAQETAPPPTPTDVRAVADDRGAIVTWEPAQPSTPRTVHTITPYVGGVAQTPVQERGSGWARVTGLTNGTAYRFTVSTANDDGQSAPSAMSPAVRPQLWAPFASADRLIRRMHRLFAFRPPTTTELTTWRDAFTAGTTTRTELVLALIDGPAWDDTVGAVLRSYAAVLRRDPDIEGVRYWRDELRSGRRTLSAVARAIGDSVEARERRARTDDAGFVEDLYVTAFGRRPTASESQYWVGRMQTGLPHWKVALLIAEAPERGVSVTTRYYSLFIGMQDLVPDANRSNSDLRGLGDGYITFDDLVTGAIGFALR